MRLWERYSNDGKIFRACKWQSLVTIDDGKLKNSFFLFVSCHWWWWYWDEVRQKIESTSRSVTPQRHFSVGVKECWWEFYRQIDGKIYPARKPMKSEKENLTISCSTRITLGTRNFKFYSMSFHNFLWSDLDLEILQKKLINVHRNLLWRFSESFKISSSFQSFSGQLERRKSMEIVWNSFSFFASCLTFFMTPTHSLRWVSKKSKNLKSQHSSSLLVAMWDNPYIWKWKYGK